MGCNPGRILEVVEVPMARPRHPEQCTSPLFLATCKHLEALIHCN